MYLLVNYSNQNYIYSIHLFFFSNLAPDLVLFLCCFTGKDFFCILGSKYISILPRRSLVQLRELYLIWGFVGVTICKSAGNLGRI